MTDTAKKCTRCGETKPEMDFGLCRNRKSGLQYRRNECKACRRRAHFEWREKNRLHIRTYSREQMRRIRARGTPDQQAARRKKAADEARLRNAGIKDEVYAAYGGYVCACCGETQPTFLSLDHVNNDGWARRKGGEPTGAWLWRRLRLAGFPSGFQVLCMNCNHSKARNGGICAHQCKEGSTAIPGEGVGSSGPKRTASHAEDDIASSA